MPGFYWKDSTSRSPIPRNAVHGGNDVDGAQIYVGKAFHNGDWIPAKVIPSKNIAYVAHGGREHMKDRFQVLCEKRLEWVRSSGGRIPPEAIDGGHTSNGEKLYVGRARHAGSLTVGKVHPSHGTCYISFGGNEIAYKDYEILVMK